jgi:sulfur carrier protein
MNGIRIQVNGAEREIQAGQLLPLLRDLGYEAEARGVAAAVNDQIVPRGEWATYLLHEGDRVEIVGAVQGG